MNMRSCNCLPDYCPKPKEIGDLSVFLKLISEKNRLQILFLLKNGKHCVCQLIEHTQLSQSLISHHLKDLKDSGLIIDHKHSKWVYYSLTPKGKNIINLIYKIKL